ncbi:MAG: hypothetical protein PHV63_01575 [Candidatus Daviesbacteria bacterium]|nr:hypothetical protein [Candidatus Daviesbacteria bacterium]
MTETPEEKPRFPGGILPWWNITTLAKETDALEGLDLSTVKKGDIIVFSTSSKNNSIYVFRVDEPAFLEGEKRRSCSGTIHGGYFEEKFKGPVDNVEIKGATWGGSSLLLHQIKKDMRVELVRHDGPSGSEDYSHWQTITTSRVKECRLIKQSNTSS